MDKEVELKFKILGNYIDTLLDSYADLSERVKNNKDIIKYLSKNISDIQKHTDDLEERLESTEDTVIDMVNDITNTDDVEEDVLGEYIDKTNFKLSEDDIEVLYECKSKILQTCYLFDEPFDIFEFIIYTVSLVEISETAIYSLCNRLVKMAKK